MLVVILWGSYWYFFEGNRKLKKGQSINVVNILENYKEDKLNKFSYTKDGAITTFVRRDDVWYVVYDNGEEHKMLERYMEELITKLNSITSAEIISTNVDKLDQFGLNENKLGITLYENIDDETPTHDFLFGKDGPFPPSQYVKIVDEDKVYLVKDTFKYTFPNKEKYEWRDVTLFDGVVDPERLFKRVTKFSFSQKDEALTFIKTSDDGWNIEGDDRTTKDNNISGLLYMALTARAFGFVDGEEKNDLEKFGLVDGKETVKIVVTLKDEEQEDIEAVAEEGEEPEIKTTDLIVLIGNSFEEEIKGTYTNISSTDSVYKITPMMKEEFTRPNIIDTLVEK